MTLTGLFHLTQPNISLDNLPGILPSISPGISLGNVGDNLSETQEVTVLSTGLTNWRLYKPEALEYVLESVA